MWKAKLKDGTVATGETHRWPDIRDSVRGLGFTYRGTEFSLPDNQSEYIFFNSGSVEMPGGEVKLESRSIGCRLENGTVVRLRFHENINKVSVETETEQCHPPHHPSPPSPQAK